MERSNMGWNDKRVLVTGGGGFIGSHLVERLVELGARTSAFIHYNSLGTWGWLDKSTVKHDIEVIRGDISDRDSVLHACRPVDIVFHLAALIGIPYSYHAPAAYVRTNIEGTLNILQAALTHQIERVVHTSTSEVYGTARYVPIDEEHPLQGQSPYSASKIGADKLVEAFHLSYELPVVTLRPFNTYGPRQSARAVIPTIVTQCLQGSVVRLGNPEPERDLNYVADTVESFICAAQNTEVNGKVINIGTGKSISIGHLAIKIAQLMDKEIRIIRDEKRMRPEKSEVMKLCAENRQAKELLGWKPMNNLDHGLQSTIDWIRNNIEFYQPDSYAI